MAATVSSVAPRAGEVAPDFTLDSTAGAPVFASANVAVLPISVDSVPTLREFKAKHALHVELLSDFRREVSRVYGVLDEDRFFARRAYFLIDRTGVVRWSHIEDQLGYKRGTDELLSKIEELE
jgi:peroxiredoxin